MENDPSDESLVCGAKVPLETDDTEYKSLTQVGSVKEVCRKIGTDWSKEFNAMLNNRGGTIHFGISDDCEVEKGVCLTDKDKDIIQMRISQAFKVFYPSQLKAFEAKFIPIPGGEPHFFRFSVVVKRAVVKGIVFISREKTVAYQRSGAMCVPIPAELLAAVLRPVKSTMDSTLAACVEAQVVLRIRDALLNYIVRIDHSDEKAILELLEPFDRLFDIFDYQLTTAREFLNLLWHIARDTRHEKSTEVAKVVANMAQDICDKYETNLQKDDFYLLCEIFFSIAYDGVRYCKSEDIFLAGACPLVSLLASKNTHVSEQYESLKETVSKESNAVYSKHLEVLEKIAASPSDHEHYDKNLEYLVHGLMLRHFYKEPKLLDEAPQT